jgi:hypothetical protein
MQSTNVNYKLLIKAAQNERRHSREIADQANFNFLVSVLAIGAVVMFGGLAVIFGILYCIHLMLRLVGII